MKTIRIVLLSLLTITATGCYTQLAIQDDNDAPASESPAISQPAVLEPIPWPGHVMIVRQRYEQQPVQQAPPAESAVRRTSGDQRIGNEKSQSAPQESPQRTSGTQRTGR